ncbi:MAG: hypothetical protein HOV87_12080 [Catenulispora sp.]|nr:hypothetical protein [Catenulispora sp.]NUT40012.1 hypothetical protein [Thermoactinospora sp.]
MRAYAFASRHADQPSPGRCPGCRHRGLRLVYHGTRGETGHASIWCPACLTGIVTCRVDVPANAAVTVPHGLLPDETTVEPDFTLVQPRRGESLVVVWGRNVTAGCAAALALTLIAAGIAALLPFGGTAFLLTHVMPAIAAVMGAALLFVRALPAMLYPEHTFTDMRPLGRRYRWRRELRGVLAGAGLLAAGYIVYMAVRWIFSPSVDGLTTDLPRALNSLVIVVWVWYALRPKGRSEPPSADSASAAGGTSG